MIRDAIVVGAGLSGLVCARWLIDAGADAIVIEARPRVGGRLWNGKVGDAVVDLGGHWLSVGQPRLFALAAELGVTSVAQRRDGRAILDDGGRAGMGGGEALHGEGFEKRFGFMGNFGEWTAN